MALRWEDIDFERGVAELSWSLTEASFQHGCNGTCGKKRAGNCPQQILEISDSLEAIPLEGRLVLVRPKNDTPRQIPLTPAAVEQLRKLRDTNDHPSRYGLVWHRPNGAPLTNTDDNDHLRTVRSLAGIDEPAATTHWLRHTYVTLSEHAGIPPPPPASPAPAAPKPPTPTATSSSEGRKAVTTLSTWVETN